jgi:antitoxin CcdA
MNTKSDTCNLSVTTKSLPVDFVDQQKQGQASRQDMANACAADWNAVHAAVGGSFADEHSTL